MQLKAFVLTASLQYRSSCHPLPALNTDHHKREWKPSAELSYMESQHPRILWPAQGTLTTWRDGINKLPIEGGAFLSPPCTMCAHLAWEQEVPHGTWSPSPPRGISSQVI